MSEYNHEVGDDAPHKAVLEAGQAALDWQRLHDWAVRHHPGAILGDSCTDAICPLALYLNTQTPGHLWSVGSSIKLIEDPEQSLQKPDWVTALIRETDLVTGDQREEVTREQFLWVLDLVRGIRMPMPTSRAYCSLVWKHIPQE